MNLRCPCGYLFSKKFNLSTHLRYFHNIRLTNTNINQYKVSFTESNEPEGKNVKSCSNESQDSLECNLCGRKFFMETKRDHHMKFHQNMTYQCPCGYMYQDYTYMCSHLRYVHKLNLCEIYVKEITEGNISRANFD